MAETEATTIKMNATMTTGLTITTLAEIARASGGTTLSVGKRTVSGGVSATMAAEEFTMASFPCGCAGSVSGVCESLLYFLTAPMIGKAKFMVL